MSKQRHLKTTLGGILAAAGTVLTASGVVPHPFTFLGPLLAAVGQVLLGHSAVDRERVPRAPKGGG